MEILIVIACIGIILLTLPLLLRLIGSVMSAIGELISNVLAIGIICFVLWALIASGIAPAIIGIIAVVLLVGVLFWIGRKAGFAFAWALRKTGLDVPLKRITDDIAQKINATPPWVVPAFVLSAFLFAFLYMASSLVLASL